MPGGQVGRSNRCIPSGLIGVVDTIVAVLLTTFRVKVIPEETLGQAVGMLLLVTDGLAAIGTLLGGYLLSWFGTTSTGMLLTGGMFMLAVAVSRVTTPAQRQPHDRAN